MKYFSKILDQKEIVVRDLREKYFIIKKKTIIKNKKSFVNKIFKLTNMSSSHSMFNFFVFVSFNLKIIKTNVHNIE
jgi:hypothetical protein